jgi:hypothetical protein
MMRARGDVLKAGYLASVAVTHGQQLAAQAPGVYDFELAATMMTLNLALAENGQPQDALQVIEQAVVVLRRLTAAHPGKFDLQLVKALGQQLELMLTLNMITSDEIERHPLVLESKAIVHRLKEQGLV